MAEFEVAEALSTTLSPAHTAVGETDAVTPVGNGFTVATTGVRVAEEQPEVMFRAAA